MTRLGTVFWLIVVLAAGFTTFKVKYAVQDIEDELNRARKQTIAEQQETRVLTAEWTYLNQPERLAELNRRFLGLAAIGAKQLQRGIEEIPLRAPAAPPAAPPDVLVDASPVPAAPPEAATASPVTQAALSTGPTISGTTREGDTTKPPDEVSAGDGTRPASSAVPVRLAKAGPAPASLDALIDASAGLPSAAKSLDALIAQISEAK